MLPRFVYSPICPSEARQLPKKSPPAAPSISRFPPYDCVSSFRLEAADHQSVPATTKYTYCGLPHVVASDNGAIDNLPNLKNKFWCFSNVINLPRPLKI